MSDTIWSTLKNFSQWEFDDPNVPGSGNYFNEDTLVKIQKLRDQVGWPIISHGPVGGAVDVDGSWGHSANSFHLFNVGSCAFDFHFDTDANPREQIYYVLNSGFTGIGLYYDWSWGSKPLNIGFHVDERPINRTQIWKRVNRIYAYLIK